MASGDLMGRREVLVLMAASAAAPLLVGCSPKFDWREVRVADSQIRLLMPAKPASRRGPFEWSGETLDFELTAAQVGDCLFTVGHAQIPELLRNSASMQALSEAFVERNAQRFGTPEGPSAVSVRRRQGDPRALLLALEYRFAAELDGQAQRLVSRFLALGQFYYNISVMGPARDLVPEVLEFFLDSVRAD